MAGVAEGAEWIEVSKLRSILEKLPSERRKLVLLAYFLGLSRVELAEREEKPVSTIKSTLRRSLVALKECLDGE